MQREHELHYRISPNRGIQMVNTLVDITKGFTVEQLEMCMAAAMEVVWGTRAEWDRDRVAEKVVEEVEAAAEDVRELQGGGGGEEDGSSYSARESV
ncbi:hypothetical protein EX30DRAFT_342002 [Ascodesmis nigricans]|uniref:Uncharacterized protein n=1 Tax=Ascodesmis nigricans TaxID=341454 RepID=A0A4S2MTS3_9PEZI|nr:hypothetical protein EX30DRAFT_342002 [Ascodesmis nigricans]